MFYETTKEFSETIRSERIMNNIKASDLAKHIKKSNAYITKLENGEIKKIDSEEMYKIFDFIVSNNDNINNKSEYIEKLLQRASIEINQTEEEEIKQKWFTTFDLQYRQLPMPQSLISYITSKLIDELNKSPQYLIEILNKNDELNETDVKESNKLYIEYDGQNKMVISIRYDLEINFLEEIINGKIDTISYINILGILYTLHRIEGIDNESAIVKAYGILRQHRLYTISERNKILKEAVENKLEYEKIEINEEDKKNNKLVRIMLKRIGRASQSNVKHANNKLEVLNTNFDNDPSLTLGILGIDITPLKDLKFETKKQFIEEIKALIDSYSKKTETSIEEY